MDVLTLENIQKGFDGADVLRGISLSVKKGQVIAIIGPSGSGKSTLLRCATLLERIDGGEIRYGERVAACEKDDKVVYASNKELRGIKESFGLVFQNFNLFPHFSVLKNVTDASVTVQKRPKDEVIAEGRELLRKMGLSDKEKAYPCQLSGGQQQRVSIARALAANPDILFFDEPTSSLDPELTSEVLSTIRALAREKMTMLVVTHEIDFARAVADTVVFMDDGVIIEQGPPSEVIDNPKSDRAKAFLRKLEQADD